MTTKHFTVNFEAPAGNHIRAHYTNGEYEIFELPFCMPVSEVIVEP